MTQDLVRVAGRPLPVTIENAQLIFKNFTGREGQYNEEGMRNFGVILDDVAIAQQMKLDGWNVKFLKPREDGDEPKPWLPVAVSYRNPNRLPRVVMIAQRFNHAKGEMEQVRTTLDEDLVMMIDYADIANVDLIVNPSPWGPNARGETGIKAYLKSIYVTIRMDALEAKYAAVPEVGADHELLQIEAGPGTDDGDIIDVDWAEEQG